MTNKWICLFLMVVVCGSSFAFESVPVLIWNTNSDSPRENVPDPSALQKITSEVFLNQYLLTFKPRNIILFLQNELSLEDFIYDSTNVQNLKEWMNNENSIFLPNVKDAAQTALDLSKHGYDVLKLEDAALNFKKNDENLVIVELKSNLEKSDGMIKEVLSKMTEKGEFTVIFTGKKPSLEQAHEERRRIARSLKADDLKADSNITNYHAGNCTKMYFRQNMALQIYSGDTMEKVIINENTTISTVQHGTCLDGNVSLAVTYGPININSSLNKEYEEIEVKFDYSKTRKGSWLLTGAQVQIFDKEGEGEVVVVYDDYFLVRGGMDAIPLTLSYSCTPGHVLVTKSSNSTFFGANVKKVELKLNNFQMQAFQEKAYFDGAWDCVGFFTLPIWTSLFVGLINVLILAYGMGMIASIKTMDRFDDPKAQPLMIAASD